MAGEPSIPEWFKNRGVLVTGATGFVGKVLVAKLLLACPQGGHIYLLVREKRGTSPSARLQELIQQEPFRAIRENHPERLERLMVISGDTAVEDLALSAVDKARLVEDVSVIFHMAANVRFDLSVRDAVTTNTKGSLNLIALAKQLANLKSFIHVSTAYCHCEQALLEERAYPPPTSPEDVMAVVDKMSDDSLDIVDHKFLNNQPNTYAFSKGLCEDLMVRSGLPVGIARPSIVTASWKEPAPGWVDNMNGPTGLIIGAGKGVIRSMQCNGSYFADVIPCDMVANATIALAWRVGVEDSGKPIFVNVTEGCRNPVTWEWAINTGEKIVQENPFSGPLWYPGGKITSSVIIHWFSALFFHILPAYLLDALIVLAGRKPFLIKIHSRVSKGLKLLQYYTTKQWVFVNDGLMDLKNRLCPEDREVFFMDTQAISWDDYLHDYILGIRKYCLKDDPSTLPRARKVFKYLYIADRILRTVLGVFILWFLYSCIIPRNIITVSVIGSKDL